jgi:ribokinase
MTVIVLGSINADLIATVPHRPAVGETVLATGFLLAAGGKGANHALAARRMGAEVRLLGAVGRDGFAEPALRLLREDGVDLSGVSEEQAATTGLGMILLDASGENSITVVPGANHLVTAPHLARLQRLLTVRDILVLQLEIPLATVQAAVAIARSAGARVVLDPAPAPDALADDLLRVDLLTPNQQEAAQLLGRPIETLDAARDAAAELHARGAALAVVKLGAQGVVWAGADGVFVEPAPAVTAVDTVGAGDVFAGACAACLDRDLPTARAIQLAVRAASLSTTRPGAQPSFPWLRHVE